MRILFVAPYPPSRVRVRSYGLLAQLRREHEVTIVALCRTEQERKDVAVLCDEGYHVVIAWEAKWKAWRRCANAFIGPTSLQVAYAQSPVLRQTVQTVYAQGKYDIVHVEHLRGIAALEPDMLAYPLVWDAVDCLSLLGKQTMVAAPDWAKRLLARLEYKRMQYDEARLVGKLAHVIVSSQRDRDAMSLVYDMLSDVAKAQYVYTEQLAASLLVLTNGVDLDYFAPVRSERKSNNLVFSGMMNYHPNVAAVLYLCQHIMPLIWQQRPEVTLTVVGGNPSHAVRRLAVDKRIEVTGFVPDIRPYIGRATVMVCPMVYSAGIQNKLLEAMALGTPVVTSSQSASALSAQAGSDLLVADDPELFAHAVLRLLDETELRTSLSYAGRRYVERYHNWQVIAAALMQVYQKVMSTRLISLLAQ